MTTATTTAIHTPHDGHVARRPATATVLRLQLRLLWATRRVRFLAALLLGALVLLEFASWRIGSEAVQGLVNRALATTIFVELLPLLVVVGGLWSLVVWRDEGPSKRHYHWSLPVDVTMHDLMRVAAGAVWLCAALAAFYALGWFLAVAHGDAAMLQQRGAALPLSFVLAPLVCYLLVSMVGVGSDRPLEWLLGLYFGVVILVMAAELAGFDFVQRFFAGVFGAEPWQLLYTMHFGPQSLVRSQLTGSATTQSMTLWLSSVMLWLVVSVAAVACVSAARRGRA